MRAWVGWRMDVCMGFGIGLGMCDGVAGCVYADVRVCRNENYLSAHFCDGNFYSSDAIREIEKCRTVC